MPIVSSKSTLSDYCLRRLGSPIINIELEANQIDDRINDTIDKFILRHYDGTDSFSAKMTLYNNDLQNGYVDLPENIVAITGILQTTKKSSTELLDNLEYNIYKELNNLPLGSGTLVDLYSRKEWLKTIENQFSKNTRYDYNGSTHTLYHYMDNNFLSYVGLSDYLTTGCTPNNSASTVTLNSNAFSFQRTYLTTWYPTGVYNVEFFIKSGTFTGSLNINVTDRNNNTLSSDTIYPTNRREHYYLEFELYNDNVEDIIITIDGIGVAGESFEMTELKMFKNPFIVLTGYKSFDENKSENIFNNEWIKKYATALLKQQWGSNIKKFSGVQLPGGTEMNGQQIYDEAVEELRLLDEMFVNTYEEPLDFMVG